MFCSFIEQINRHKAEGTVFSDFFFNLKCQFSIILMIIKSFMIIAALKIILLYLLLVVPFLIPAMKPVWIQIYAGKVSIVFT